MMGRMVGKTGVIERLCLSGHGIWIFFVMGRMAGNTGVMNYLDFFWI